MCFDAGLSCPNRDGKIGKRGCIFCSEGGSGEFSVNITRYFDKKVDITQSPVMIPNLNEAVREAVNDAKKQVESKFQGNRFIAYFQAFSNTYGSIDYLTQIYDAVLRCEEIKVLSIATRPDCLNEEIYELLERLVNIKPIWIELGLQTVKEESISFIRRGYPNDVFDSAVRRLKSLGIHVITHVILYLPGESKEDMLNTVRHAVAVGTDGIKLQELMILKGTDLCRLYENEDIDMKFHIPDMDEYIETVKECIGILPENTVVHRMTGDPPKRLLVEPKWAWNKKKILNSFRMALLK